MSTVIAKNVQVGTSGTATDNFTIFQPATPDGTLRIGNGNTGITTSQVALTSAGNVGIGINAPTLNTNGTVLHINNSTASRAAILHCTNAESGSTSADGLIVGKWSDGTNYFFDYDSYPLVFGNAGTNRMVIDTSGNLQFNSGYGSVATAYGCRAWINFNGTGTPAIRGSGNFSSITDNGTGDYTLNFTTSLPDTNYCPVVGGDFSQGATRDNGMYLPTNFTFATSSLRISVTNYAGAYTDIDTVMVSIFR